MLIGAPAWDTANFMTWLSYIQFLARGKVDLTVADATALNTIVLQNCDTLNGAKEDHMVTAPLACYQQFNKTPALWGDAVTKEQLKLVQLLLEPLKDTAGNVIFEGYDISAMELINAFIDKTSIFDKNGDRDFAKYFLGLSGADNTLWHDDGSDYYKAVKTWDAKFRAGAHAEATKNFKGKMMMYVGLRDDIVPTPHTFTYFEQVKGVRSDRDSWLKYYEVPGMQHCVSSSSSFAPWYIGPGGFQLVEDGSVFNITSSSELNSAKHDMLESLATWVEGKDKEPPAVTAVSFKKGAWANGGTFEIDASFDLQSITTRS
jgi:hypothetical protein